MTERRTRWLFLVLLLGQLLLLTAQIPAAGAEESYLEKGLLRLVGPLMHLVASTSDLITGLTDEVALNRRLKNENQQLRAEVIELRRRQIELFGVREDLERLTAALEYQRAAPGPLKVADIVFIDHTSWLQNLVMAVKGGAEKNQPVVSAKGLVGRVVLVSGPYAKVQLITDRAASVGVMLERTRRQGIVRGVGRGGLELGFVPLQADVRVADTVVTAGIDGVYPRGIPVGRVAVVEPGDELFLRIRVTPSVEFGLLDQVYVLDREPIPDEVKASDAQP